MDYVEILRTVAAQNGGVIKNKTALLNGIQRHVLAKLCADGILQRVSRGRYVFPEDIEALSLSPYRPPNT